MKAISGWSDLAIDRARDKIPDAERFRDKSDVLFWWCADENSNLQHEVLYWELRYSRESRAWIVFGAVFAMAFGDVYVGVGPFVAESPFDASGGAHTIRFNALGPGHYQEYRCAIELETDPAASRYRIVTIRTAIAWGPGWKTLRPVGKVTAGSKADIAAATRSGTYRSHIDVTCPDCHGFGYSRTFAIPKEDLDSGVTGYELYSCNRLNSSVACATCGGEGVTYEPWYLEEKPELRAQAQPYRKGSGRISVERLPSSGALGSV